MSAKRLGWTIGVLTLLGAAAYLFVYLYRWEWNRATIAGIFVLVAEVALLGSAILDKLGKLQAAQVGSGADPDAVARALAHLRDTAPPPRDQFAWLRPQAQRMSVFVPVLMGAGAVLSGLAWLVERLARATANPALERGLATQVARLAVPEGGLVVRAGDVSTGRAGVLLAPVRVDGR